MTIPRDDRPDDVGFNPYVKDRSKPRPPGEPDGPVQGPPGGPGLPQPHESSVPDWYRGKIPWYRTMFHDANGVGVTWGDLLEAYGPGFEFTVQDAAGVERVLFVLDPNMSLDEWFGSGDSSDLSPADYIGGAYKDPDFLEDADIDPAGGGSGGGGGGGRGGSSSRVAATPDEGAVEDQVKAYVVATTGKAHEGIIRQGVEAYMSNVGSEGVDPWQSMKETVRGTTAYKAVNDGRPDSVDEMEWVSGMQAKLRQIGLSAAKAEDLGVSGAIAGNTDEALVDAGEMRHFDSTGRMLQSQRNSLKRSAAAAAKLVV